MGRHSSTVRRRRSRSPVILLSVLLVVGLAVWFVYDFLRVRLQASQCDATTVINVTAAEDIGPVVSNAAKKVSEEDTEHCYKVNVAVRDSATTAESLVVSDGTERPDVWIPESTLWLQRAQDKGAWNTPVNGTSIASSPVVLALTEDVANQLGWPDATPTWAQVIGPSAGNIAVGLPDPAHDPVGVSTLFGLRDLTKGLPDPGAAGAASMRKLSDNTVPQTSDLFGQLPGSGNPKVPLGAFPTSENSLLRHNVKENGQQLVAAYADPAVPALDYPYVVLPETPDAKRDAAERFLAVLINQETSDALADAGFRTPDGKALRDRSQDKRTSAKPLTPVPLPNAIDVDKLLNEWATVNLAGRDLVLLDVSGSMNEQVPGTGKTRLGITLQAAELGIGLFKKTSKFGVWLFSTDLDGDKDYKELLPMLPVTEHVAGGAIEKLRGVQAKPNGNTGLYDSVLAAYQSARQNWEPGRLNVVIVLTDGQNDNASGITRDALLAELAKLQDPRRPLQVIGIGIGPDVDPAELQAISAATGGNAYTTPDPTKIVNVFYAALSKLLCQPPNCKTGA